MEFHLFTTKLNNTNIHAHLENFENKKVPFANSYSEIVHITEFVKENRISSPVSDIYDYARSNSLFALIMIYLTNNTLADDVPGEFCSLSDKNFMYFIKFVKYSFLTDIQIMKLDKLMKDLEIALPERLLPVAKLMVKKEIETGFYIPNPILEDVTFKRRIIKFNHKSGPFATSYAEVLKCQEFLALISPRENVRKLYELAEQHPIFAVIMIYVTNKTLCSDAPFPSSDMSYQELHEITKKATPFLLEPQQEKLRNLMEFLKNANNSKLFAATTLHIKLNI